MLKTYRYLQLLKTIIKPNIGASLGSIISIFISYLCILLPKHLVLFAFFVDFIEKMNVIGQLITVSLIPLGVALFIFISGITGWIFGSLLHYFVYNKVLLQKIKHL